MKRIEDRHGDCWYPSGGFAIRSHRMTFRAAREVVMSGRSLRAIFRGTGMAFAVSF